VESTPERVAQGQRLAEMLCIKCHLNPETGKLTGKLIDDLPEEFGIAYSKNITRHPEKGIGKWTDGELIHLIRTGISRDGQYTPPYMVKLPKISDEDLYSIIAYLRSDDPRLDASDVSNTPSEPSFLTKFLCTVAFKPFEMPKEKITAPDIKTDKVAYGRYLATEVLGCFACHSADFKTMNEMEPEKSEGFFGGGNPILNHDRKVIYSANITMDKETGIGNWTEAEFIKSLREAVRPDGKLLRYPMEPYLQLTEEEASAIYAYLQTVPVINKKVERQF
jgi:mono/diheme cytochrome c family protein